MHTLVAYLLFQTTTANFSLFPLLYREQECLVKIFLHLFYASCCSYILSNSSLEGQTWTKGPTSHRKVKKSHHSNDLDQRLSHISIIQALETLYMIGSVAVFLFPYFISIYFDTELVKKYQFLPLLNYSIYCAFGNMYVLTRYYWNFVIEKNTVAQFIM